MTDDPKICNEGDHDFVLDEREPGLLPDGTFVIGETCKKCARREERFVAKTNLSPSQRERAREFGYNV